MEAFFSDFYGAMDLHYIEFVDQELVDFPGKKHKIMDKVIKTRLYGESDYTLFFLSFKFYTLVLRRLSWKDYIHYNNPAVAALLSSMSYDKEERLSLKLAFYKMLLRMKLDPARQRLVILYFESYLTLSREENKELDRLIRNEFSLEEVNKMEEMMIEWEIQGYEKAKDDINRLKDQASRAQDEASRAEKHAKQYKEELDQAKEESIEMILHYAKQHYNQIPSGWPSTLKELSLKELFTLRTAMIENKPLSQIQQYIKDAKDAKGT